MGNDVRVCVVSASRQNVFFSEILEALGSMLAEAGVTVEESIDCMPPVTDDIVYMFIPHEFNSLVEELAHPTPAQLARSVVICTEQPGTPWFDLSAGVAARAGAVLDINTFAAAELRRRGIAAEHLPIGYVPQWDAWGGAKRDRSLDLVFLGGYEERRGEVLARSVPHLECRRAAIKLTETGQPHTGESRAYWSRRRKWENLADAKLLLNVHRSATPYLEWHRVLGAQINGCVVITEHSVGVEPLVPGEHYVSAGYWQLPEVLGAVLEDPERIARIRQDAYAFLREEMPASRTRERLRAAVERVGRTPVIGPPEPAPVPLPAPPQEPNPAWEEYADWAGGSLALRKGLKHLIVRVQGLERHLEALIGGESAEGDGETVVHLGPEIDEPRVSVLLTVHNYADFVGDAIRSVALNRMRGVEVIAVDDASSDSSVAAVEASCDAYPWLPLTHVRLNRNRGLPAARNLAASHARADLLFVLDADNEILPCGLQRLATALEQETSAGAAYGIVEAFDSSGPVGLMSWLPWDAARLRQGNYIDAMAMFRRSALEAVGGYSTDPALYGWEDFALWLAFAEKGLGAVHLPDFIGRYRRSQHSMISLSNIDSTAAWETLLRRFPSIAEPQSFR